MSRPWPDRPVVLQIDLNQATFQSFLNCINSFQGLETESGMEKGASYMVSRVSMERFTDNLGVLAGLTGHDSYDPEMDKKKAFTYWLTIVKKLKDDGFFKSPRKIAHL